MYYARVMELERITMEFHADWVYSFKSPKNRDMFVAEFNDSAKGVPAHAVSVKLDVVRTLLDNHQFLQADKGMGIPLDGVYLPVGCVSSVCILHGEHVELVTYEDWYECLKVHECSIRIPTETRLHWDGGKLVYF